MNTGEEYRPYAMFVGLVIPITLLRAEGLSPLAKLLFARLAFYLGRDAQACTVSKPTLAKEISVSLDKIERALSELCDFGLIVRRRRGPGKEWETRFLWHPILEGSLRTKDKKAPVDSAPIRIKTRLLMR